MRLFIQREQAVIFVSGLYALMSSGTVRYLQVTLPEATKKRKEQNVIYCFA